MVAIVRLRPVNTTPETVEMHGVCLSGSIKRQNQKVFLPFSLYLKPSVIILDIQKGVSPDGGKFNTPLKNSVPAKWVYLFIFALPYFQPKAFLIFPAVLIE